MLTSPGRLSKFFEKYFMVGPEHLRVQQIILCRKEFLSIHNALTPRPSVLGWLLTVNELGQRPVHAILQDFFTRLLWSLSSQRAGTSALPGSPSQLCSTESPLSYDVTGRLFHDFLVGLGFFNSVPSKTSISNLIQNHCQLDMWLEGMCDLFFDIFLPAF